MSSHSKFLTHETCTLQLDSKASLLGGAAQGDLGDVSDKADVSHPNMATLVTSPKPKVPPSEGGRILLGEDAICYGGPGVRDCKGLPPPSVG